MPETPNSSHHLDEIFRDYAMQYFTLHAEQRLKMFQFYISLSTAIMGGSLLIFRYGHQSRWITLLWFFLAFLSFIFWKLDGRSRTLIRNAEEALKFLDSKLQLPDVDGAPHPLTIFARDDKLFGESPKFPLLYVPFSYTRSFKYVFAAVSCLGISAGVFGLVYFN